MPPARSLRKFLPALLLFTLAVLILAGLPWRCPLLAITGHPCPTCGLTRATRLALHGDFAAATRMHPLWPIVGPACVALGVAETVGFVRRGAWGVALDRKATGVVVVGVAALLIAVWIARFAGALGGPVPG
jgi:hypothetical protein